MATPDYSTGSMLCLYPDDATARALAIPGGLPVTELHVTIAYTGKAADVDLDKLLAAGQALAGRQPFTARISGHARFTGGPDGDVIVALVDSPHLEQLRRDTLNVLGAEGVAIPAEHGYVAHMTLAYIAADDPDPVGRIEPTTVTFTGLSVIYADKRTTMPFAGGLAALAREAYAQGWAASGGPMTDRVKAGCTAAVDLALANADQPGVLEATLHLGHLEGTWAAIYDRREQLHASNQAAVQDLWHGLDLGRHAGELVARARRRAHLTEAAGPDDWLAALVDQLVENGMTAAQLDQVRDAVREAFLQAAAEGQAGALAISAEQLGQVGFGFDLAFEHAYNALSDAPGLIAGDGTVNEWLTRLLGDQANEVGAALSRMTRDGASAAEMEATVAGILDGADSRALRLGVDVLTSRAMSQGALDLYQSEGVEWVDFITAGDQRVCTEGPNCAAAEMNSPYRLTDAPIPGLHPLCRCTLAGTMPMPGDTTGRFLSGAGEEDEEADLAVAAGQVPAAAAPYLLNLNGIQDLAAAAEEAAGELGRPLVGGSVSDTRLVTLPDGRQVVHKASRTTNADRAKTQADAEQAVSILARALNLKAPRVYRNEVDAVWMDYIDEPSIAARFSDATIADAAGGTDEAVEGLKDQLAIAIDTDQGQVAGLLDMMIANNDRHAGNWLLDDAGEPVLIDHGYAFGPLLTRGPVSPPLLVAPENPLFVSTTRGPFAVAYVDGDVGARATSWAENGLTPADIQEIRTRLSGLADQFEHLGHVDWLEYAQSVLDVIEPYATGTRNLIAD